MADAGSRQGARDAILDAAIGCFLESGYEGTSMDAVARRAGSARQTVFNNFASKEALFEAAVARLWRQLPVGEALGSPEEGRHTADGLRRLGHAIDGFLARPEMVPLIRLVIAEGQRFPFLAEMFSRCGRQPAIDALVAHLSELHRRDVLHVPDAELAALQFIALTRDVLWWPVIIGVAPAPDQARRDAVIDAAVALMLRQYGTSSRVAS